LTQQENNTVNQTTVIGQEQYIFQEENKFSVYINKAIGAPSRYTELFDLLQSATENEHIDFFLNTVGGRLDTTAQLVAMMDNTRASTSCHILGPVMSAGTLIALAADDLSVSAFGYMMIHNASGGTPWDKVNLTAQYANHSKSWCEGIFRKVYASFLTEDEIDRLIKNEDFYFDQEEILNRWETVLETRESLAEENPQVSALETALATIKEQLKAEILEELTQPN
jgi:ATP-dependent protease ClpP protease subunit